MNHNFCPTTLDPRIHHAEKGLAGTLGLITYNGGGSFNDVYYTPTDAAVTDTTATDTKAPSDSTADMDSANIETDTATDTSEAKEKDGTPLSAVAVTVTLAVLLAGVAAIIIVKRKKAVK